jgi:hypothetical protein
VRMKVCPPAGFLGDVEDATLLSSQTTLSCCSAQWVGPIGPVGVKEVMAAALWAASVSWRCQRSDGLIDIPLDTKSQRGRKGDR